MFELTLQVPHPALEDISDALEALDALSVSVEDADALTDAEQALFGEPGMVPAQIGWNRSRIRALFGTRAQADQAAGVLAANTRQLKDGGPLVSAAPAGAQPLLESMMPLVDRAEKNANAVLAQQNALVQVGKALRTINTQSGELLETAETVSSLKLQQGAAPALSLRQEDTLVGRLPGHGRQH